MQEPAGQLGPRRIGVPGLRTGLKPLIGTGHHRVGAPTRDDAHGADGPDGPEQRLGHVVPGSLRALDLVKTANPGIEPVPQLVDIHALAIEQLVGGADESVEEIEGVQPRLVERCGPSPQRLTEGSGVERHGAGGEYLEIGGGHHVWGTSHCPQADQRPVSAQGLFQLPG